MKTFLLTAAMPAVLLIPELQFRAASQEVETRIARAQGKSHAHAILPLTPESLGIYSGELEDNCDLPFFRFSPSGRYLVAAKDNWRRTTAARSSLTLTITDLDCAGKKLGAANCVVTFQALDGLRLASWEANEKGIFIIEQDRALVHLRLGEADLTATRIAGRIALAPNLASTIASVDLSPSRSVADEAARLRAADGAIRRNLQPGETVLSLHVRAGEAPAALVERAPDLAATLITGNGRIGIDVPGPGLMQSDISFEPDGSHFVYSTGMMSPATQALGPAPYERPVLSARSGKTIGFFAPFAIRRADTAPAAPQASDTIVAASLHESGDQAMLVRNGLGALVFQGRRKGNSWRVSCGAAPASERTSSSWIDLGTAQRPLPAVLTRSTRQGSRPLLVYFPGGPAAGIVDPEFDLVVKSFRKLGFDVLSVNYSGSSVAGGGLLMRVAREGPLAFRRDAEAVAASALIHSENAPITVAGASLGALPALALSARLGPGNHRLVLLEPFLKHRAPREWSPTADYQQAFEHRLLGLAGDKEASALNDLASQYQRNRGAAPTFLAFGTQDPVSRVADWSSPRATDRIIELPANHAFLPFMPALWDQLRAWEAASGSITPPVRKGDEHDR